MNHPVAPPDRPLEAVARELAEANTRLKQTNEELARLYEKSRDMDELKSRFFAMIDVTITIFGVNGKSWTQPNIWVNRDLMLAVFLG